MVVSPKKARVRMFDVPCKLFSELFWIKDEKCEPPARAPSSARVAP